MGLFASDEQLYGVIQAVFDRLAQDPETIAALSQSNLVIRLNLLDPEAQVLLDGRQPPLEVFFGERPGQANLEFTMQADLLHSIWLDETSASQAFFTGQIKSRGNLLQATHLIELFRECERVYPEIAAAHGLA